VLSQQPSCQ